MWYISYLSCVKLELLLFRVWQMLSPDIRNISITATCKVSKGQSFDKTAAKRPTMPLCGRFYNRLHMKADIPESIQERTPK